MAILVVPIILVVLGIILVWLGWVRSHQSPKSSINQENQKVKAGEFFTHYRGLELQAPHIAGVPDPQPELLV